MLFNYFKNHFGGKKKALFWFRDFILWKLGKYRNATHIDWNKVHRILFICKGNICRSAYAEAYLSSNHPHINTTSCGVETSDGAPADESAKNTAHQRGYKLTSHKTSRVEDTQLFPSDLIVYMEPAHKTMLLEKISETPGSQHTFLGLWGNTPPLIPDPYGTSTEYFEHCFILIETCVDAIVSNMTNKIS